MLTKTAMIVGAKFSNVAVLKSLAVWSGGESAIVVFENHFTMYKLIASRIEKPKIYPIIKSE